MNQAKFLNLETKQVQILDSSLDHPNLIRMSDGAEESELKAAYNLLDIANKNAQKHSDEASLYRNIAFTFSIVIIALVFILMGVLVWG